MNSPQTTIDQPGMVPLSCVGREPVFMFGTLLHPAVLALVLDRSLDRRELTPARLFGYRRVRAENAVYPILVPDDQDGVDGLIITPRSIRDLVRINHFEEDEYHASQVDVWVAQRRTTAWAFIGLPLMQPCEEPWDLDRWAGSELEGFLERCAFWMADSPL